MTSQGNHQGQAGLYRKKPVVIEARQLPLPQDVSTEGMRSLQETAEWCSGVITPAGVIIRTLEGDMTARPGEWVIKGVKGEFYPCKDEIFRQTYEPVGGVAERPASAVTFEDHRWYTVVRENGKFLRAFAGGREFSGLGVFEADEEEAFRKWKAGE